MPDFLIRDLDEDTMRRLRERAERHHRSLQAEIKHTLRQSLKLSKAESMELIKKLQEETKGRGGPDSTQVIREFRDSH